jgi:hypothetical protein
MTRFPHDQFAKQYNPDFSQEEKKRGSKTAKTYRKKGFQQLDDMTPTQTDCIPEQFNFGRTGLRKVIANFQGGSVTSDAGLSLIAALDQKRQITVRFAECFQDYRDPLPLEHSVNSLVAQRVLR